MVKIMEDIQVKYDNSVRTVDDSIVQFSYGNNTDPTKTFQESKVCDIHRMVERLNAQVENG